MRDANAILDMCGLSHLRAALNLHLRGLLRSGCPCPTDNKLMSINITILVSSSRGSPCEEHLLIRHQPRGNAGFSALQEEYSGINLLSLLL